MLGQESHVADMPADQLGIEPDRDTAGLDPLAEGLVLPLVTIGLEVAPGSELGLWCQLGEPALYFEEHFLMDQGAAETDPVHLDQASGGPFADIIAEQLVLVGPGPDLGLDHQLAHVAAGRVDATDDSLASHLQAFPDIVPTGLVRDNLGACQPAEPVGVLDWRGDIGIQPQAPGGSALEEAVSQHVTTAPDGGVRLDIKPHLVLLG